MMDFVPIKTPSARVTTAGQTLEFLDPLLRIGSSPLSQIPD
jgi:hypothetical protein